MREIEHQWKRVIFKLIDAVMFSLIDISVYIVVVIVIKRFPSRFLMIKMIRMLKNEYSNETFWIWWLFYQNIYPAVRLPMSLSLSTTVSFVVLSLNIPILLEGNTKSPIMALGKTYYCKVENFENHIDLTSDREPRWKAGRTTNPSANGIKNDIPIKLLCNKWILFISIDILRRHEYSVIVSISGIRLSNSDE